jgi:hypothetical protein
MVATINLPGSSYFKHFHGTKQECKDWLNIQQEEYEKFFGSTWFNCYSPAMIHSEKEFKKLKYQDGRSVCKCFDNRRF